MKMPIQRRKCRQINLGGVAIGGDAPISVQSMTTTRTADVDATLQQIASLVAAGVDIVRVAVPHWEDAEALATIAARSTVPIVADIHFHYKRAIEAAEAGAAPAVFNPATAGQPKPYPTQKILVTTLEVVIAKRSTDAQGRDFVIRTLLNYDPLRKAPVKPAQPCAVKNPYWELAEGQGPTGFWQVELDHPITEALAWPVPRGFQKRLETEPERKNYWRYRVTLQIPVGEEQRKALAAADKGGEKK